MNKRRRKKEFKKVYGYNPKDIRNSINSISDIIQRLIYEISDMFRTVANFMKDLPGKVQSMPGDEFQKLMENENLSLENKALLLKLRNKDRIQSD